SDVCSSDLTEHGGSKQDEERSRQEMSGAESRADDQEFALKQAERRRPDYGQRGDAEGRSGQRQDAEYAALDPMKEVCLEALINITDAQEQRGFGNRVKRHVQHQGETSQGAADTQRGEHNTRVLDGVI